MARKKNKAVFVVKKYPYNHPDEDELEPVGAEVDLSHQTIAERTKLVERGYMEPTTDDALFVAEPVKEPEPPKLNKHGLPFGQAPPAKAGDKE